METVKKSISYYVYISVACFLDKIVEYSFGPLAHLLQSTVIHISTAVALSSMKCIIIYIYV